MSMYSDSVRAFLKPILPFLDDVGVSEIMVNAPDEIWVERSGKVTLTDARFTEEGLVAAARNIAQYVGRVLNEERPRLDARLPDGSRIHIVLTPVARKGPVICIRKFFPSSLGMEKLIEFGAATPELGRLIEAAVQLRLNIIVAGGTGSGKTTLLNVVSRFIPEHERILTIEDSAELQLQQPHIIAFESRPADKFGKGQVTMGDLLDSALRLRPDRIVVGEVRGGEAFYLLQAMNTGHGGSLATTHANTPIDTLRRLETLCLMSGVDLPMVAVRAQVASALNLVVCCERLSDGSRKITHVAEVLPLNAKGEYRVQDLYLYTATGKTADGKVQGYHAPTGILPTFLDALHAHGYADLDARFFDPATYGRRPPPATHVDREHKTRWAPSLKHRESGGEDPPVAEPLERTSPPAQPAPAPTVEGKQTQAPLPPPIEPVPSLSPPAESPPMPLSGGARPSPSPSEDFLIPLAQVTAPATPPAPPPAAAKPPASVPPPGATRPPEPRDVGPEPSIQIAPELLEEVERQVVNEETYVHHRNPLFRTPASPRIPSAQPRPTAPVSDERTDPHIRLPSGG